MKTAVTVLQEMMMKLGEVPEYECVAQTGPQHQAMFEYRCQVLGEQVTASARSKKEAKQEVAKLMLQTLGGKGHLVPPEFVNGTINSNDVQVNGCASMSAGDTRSYVALLRELCEEFRLGEARYELVGDAGPAHLRHFTWSARLGRHERVATATTKRAARQRAAEELYCYLRENLHRLTKDFDETEALARAHEKNMERPPETNKELPRRPDLGLKIIDYPRALDQQLGAARKQILRELLETERDRISESPERVMLATAEVMELDVQWEQLQLESGAPLQLLQLSGCTPELVAPGSSRADAARAALRYVRYMLFDELDEPNEQLPTNL